MEFTVNFDPSDISNIAFAKLFGENWWQVWARGNVDPGPLIPILESINLTLLSGITVWGLYMITIASVGTANDGSFGGKKYNSFWWPVRFFASLGMTVPVTAGGLSAFQIAILTALGYSCSFANAMLDKSLDYLAQSNFAVVTADAPQHIKVEAKEIATVLFQANVTQRHRAQRSVDLAADIQAQGMDVPFIPWSSYEVFSVNAHSSTLGDSGSPRWIFKFTAPPYSGIQDADMGRIEIPGDPGDPMMLAKQNGIVAMQSIIDPVAAAIARGEKVESGWMTQATHAYEGHVLNVLNNFAAAYPQFEITKQAQEFKDKAKGLGWMAAGSWPMIMSSMSREAADRTFVPVSTSPMDVAKVTYVVTDMDYNDYGQTMTAAQSVINKEPDPSSIGTSIKDAMMTGDLGGMLDGPLYGLSGRIGLESLLERLETQDPTLVIAKLGHSIIDTGVAIWTTGLLVTGFSAGWDGWSQSIPGKVVGFMTGGISEGGAKGFSAGAKYVVDWLKVLCAGLFVAGVLFAYVFPAMPMIYWVLAMVSFLLLVVEVLIAAPFWAAAHAWSTKEDGVAGEMGAQGYLQFLEILFKPTLYVLGFIAVFLIMRVAGFIVARLFEAFYYSYSHSDISSVLTHTGMLTSLFMCIMLGAMFMYMFYYLCSEGYSHLPSKVMRWIGHQADTMGLAGQAEGMRQMIMGGVHGAMHSRKSPNFLPTPKDSKKKGDGEGGSKGETTTVTNPHLPAGVTQKQWAGSGVVGTGPTQSETTNQTGTSENP